MGYRLPGNLAEQCYPHGYITDYGEYGEGYAEQDMLPPLHSFKPLVLCYHHRRYPRDIPYLADKQNAQYFIA